MTNNTLNELPDHGDWADWEVKPEPPTEPEATWGQFQQLRAIPGFVRKPLTWAEVGDPVPGELREGLRCFTAEELGIDIDITKEFPHHMQLPGVFLVLRGDRGLYLVSTEYSNYARYVRYIGQWRLDSE